MRLLVCLGLALPAVVLADLRTDLQAKYRQLDQAIARKDVASVSAWIKSTLTPDFTYTSKDKNRYTRARFEKGLRDQIAVTKTVNRSSTKISTLKSKGAVATLDVDSDTDAIVIFDTRSMKLVDKSRTVDTWVQAGGVWRLKMSVQVKGDTQMFPGGK